MSLTAVFTQLPRHYHCLSPMQSSTLNIQFYARRPACGNSRQTESTIGGHLVMQKCVQWATDNSLIDENKAFEMFRLTQAHQHQDGRVMISPVNVMTHNEIWNDLITHFIHSSTPVNFLLSVPGCSYHQCLVPILLDQVTARLPCRF